VAAISDRRAASTNSSSEGVRLLDRLARLFGAPAEGKRDSGGESIFTWGTLEVRRLLGRGSFGEVYAAWDATLHREVALKLRAPEVGTLRWLDEARNLARIRHPNVLTVHGADVLDGRAGIWTERIDGQTLEEILSRDGPLAEVEVVRIGRDLAAALAAVHDAGLVHGDVKTSNIMLEAGAAPRRAVLVDFGSADKPIVDDVPAYTIGTPLTMAPEVLEGRPASGSSDVYGLGTTLFRLLTGRYPVEAESIDELKRAHASRQRLGLRALAPNVSARLARVIERALAPDPVERWPSAHTFRRALDDVADPTRRIRMRGAAVGAGAATLAAIATIVFLATRPGGPISRGKLTAPLMPGLFREAWQHAGTPHLGFGWVVATPDLDGDGRSELVSSEGQWRDASGKDRGRLLVFKGTSNGPDSTSRNGWVGDHEGEWAGNQLASAGDVNGDGFEDLLVATMPPPGIESPRCVKLLLGSSSGIRVTPAWTISSSAGRDTGLGLGMSSAGDVNGDGFSDVLIGETGSDDPRTNGGNVRLYLGSASGLSPNAAWTAYGGQTEAAMGGFMRPVGDVNGDGYDDVLVAAFEWDGASTDCGQARLYFGGARGPAEKPVWTFDGAGPNSHLGNTVAGADVNGDGYSDVVIGEPQYSEVSRPERGRALVFFGGPHGPSRLPDWQALGPVAYAHFGFSVAGLGDVDGDGFQDIAISATHYTEGKRDHLGMVEVYRGGKRGCETRAAWRVIANRPDSHLGQTVVGGDLNGDHIPDLVICAPLWGDKEPARGLILAFLGQRRK
jgi:hypothetical protein